MLAVIIGLASFEHLVPPEFPPFPVSGYLPYLIGYYSAFASIMQVQDSGSQPASFHFELSPKYLCKCLQISRRITICLEFHNAASYFWLLVFLRKHSSN